MIVFADSHRREPAAAMLTAIRAVLAEAAALPAGLERHSALVTALIESGELLQGVADAAFRSRGDHDENDARIDAATALVQSIATACADSWSNGFAAGSADAGADLERAAALLTRDEIEIKRPEGYAYYLLYPETYLEAARRCAARRPGDRWQVVGVRSIGTSLASIVAVGLGAAAPVTVRPVGHPFARRLAAARDLIDFGVDRYAVVDEGPGRSGSSLAAVVRWLGDAGIGAERIDCFVGHRRGPGQDGDAAIRAIWQRAEAEGRVHSLGFDDVFLAAEAPLRRLETWVSALVGPLEQPLLNVGGGGWRTLQRRDRSELPPAHPWQERRKFIAVAQGRRWLVKFAGLGRIGRHALARAASLARAGFTVAPVGLCHGFLVEPWRDDATPLPEPIPAPLRQRLLQTIAAYLAFRARSFAAPADSGASMQELLAMARSNAAEALGDETCVAWERWRSRLDELAGAVRRVETDSRMHRWEWLVGADAIVKADALDHHAGHDLVGCQDIAWDVAGAIVELELDADETRSLIAGIAAHGVTVSGDLVDFLRLCYPAFQLGHCREAEQASGDADEAARLGRECARYASWLRR